MARPSPNVRYDAAEQRRRHVEANRLGGQAGMARSECLRVNSSHQAYQAFLSQLCGIILLAPLSKAVIIVSMVFLGGWIPRREFIELLGGATALGLEVSSTLPAGADEIFE
jgi:hypothetical protein